MKICWRQITILLLACLGIGRAQTDAPLRLNLGQSVKRALAQNPEVQIADLQVAESQQDRKIVRSALLPNVSLEASERVRRLNVETLIGHELPAFGRVSGPFQAMVAGPTFSTPIFDLRLWKNTTRRKTASPRAGQTRRPAAKKSACWWYRNISVCCAQRPMWMPRSREWILPKRCSIKPRRCTKAELPREWMRCARRSSFARKSRA